MVTVSTLIPVFNGENHVRDAVDSALIQSHADHEIIVIDDGSTDSTPEILESYGDQIRVLRQRNAGHVNARNNGAKIARGEWLAFLDADDKWLGEKLEKQLAVADQPTGMVYTDRMIFGDTERVSGKGSDSYELWEGDIFEKLMLHGNFVTVASVMMRREWFDRLGGFDEELNVVEDWDMWLRFSAAGGITRVCHEPLTLYRWHSSSMSNDQAKMCDGRLKVLERALNSERGLRMSAVSKRRALAEAWKCSAWHAMPWRKLKALQWYFNSARYYPCDAGVYKQMVKCCVGRV